LKGSIVIHAFGLAGREFTQVIMHTMGFNRLLFRDDVARALSPDNPLTVTWLFFVVLGCCIINFQSFRTRDSSDVKFVFFLLKSKLSSKRKAEVIRIDTLLLILVF
jgi:hypothetical protein